jgi:glycerol-3-phosphate dehydrogenase
VLNYYRRHYPLKSEVKSRRHFNPGGGYVSKLCHEFKVAHAVLNAMLAADESAGRIRILLHTKAVSADVDGDRVKSVTVRNQHTGNLLTISANYYFVSLITLQINAIAKYSATWQENQNSPL